MNLNWKDHHQSHTDQKKKCSRVSVNVLHVATCYFSGVSTCLTLVARAWGPRRLRGIVAYWPGAVKALLTWPAPVLTVEDWQSL